ncbi:DnaJ domain-containing protein [Leptospira bandrabouensis]|uniref:DnaJ domain-containing protein n=1 Tax=Leptospira bandrabouensis TaxID=2484903 RepID=UPI001EE9323F|nr:DnaJ domain-containing protein [Leptospira bandrabouensis]MCG6146508.1 DnaJ domain-containing protein [Leptospira bandrabouensis]MCG6161880.1 DnaJ domain-containing protein [Leptospira bandrabouensis]MCG6166069.1 DnaJ domain-containing protein [Leptospira bandrabouensis]
MGKYYDPDLNSLFKKCNDDELLDIVDIILKNSQNKLTKDKHFQKGGFYPKNYIPSLVHEIRRMGSNDIATFLRGEGVSYSEIVEDVADKIKLPNVIREDCDDVASLEKEILIYMMEKAYEKMTKEEKANFEKSFKEVGYSEFGNFSSIPFSIGLISATINASGFFAYKMTAIVANAIVKQILGRGLSFAFNAGMMRGISILAGPVGWAISALWLGIDIASPATRTTIPLVILIASLRMKKEAEKREKLNEKLQIADTRSDPYSILEIFPEDSDEVIRKAYYSKCKKFHPDKFASQGLELQIWAEDEFKKINNAYETIQKERLRR